MTHYHNNHALVGCIDPTSFRIVQDSPQQFEALRGIYIECFVEDFYSQHGELMTKMAFE